MSVYLIKPPLTVCLPVQGTSSLFPVNRVYCVGQNYAAHAQEMGGDPARQKPFFFCKAPQCVTSKVEFTYPSQSQDVQHEIELVVAIGKGGKEISAKNALDHVIGYGVGLDMTRRDLQSQAKKAGRPWETAKAFDGSAPCSNLILVQDCGHPASGAIWLNLNGVSRQGGNLNQMIWKVPEVISQLSSLFTLCAGDLVFTGTPSGVGSIQKGDVLSGGVDGVAELEVRVT